MTTDREELSWEIFGSAARELAAGVSADGFEPDLILAIARGGLFVAGALGYALGVKNVAVINVEFYTGVGERLDVPVVLPPVPSTVDLGGARMLIADDVADTGATCAWYATSAPTTSPTPVARCSTRSRIPRSTVNTCGDARIAGSTSRGRPRPRLGP